MDPAGLSRSAAAAADADMKPLSSPSTFFHSGTPRNGGIT